MVLGTVVVGCEKNKLDENPTESRYEVSLRDSQNEITIILKEVTPEVNIIGVDNPLKNQLGLISCFLSFCIAIYLNLSPSALNPGFLFPAECVTLHHYVIPQTRRHLRLLGRGEK